MGTCSSDSDRDSLDAKAVQEPCSPIPRSRSHRQDQVAVLSIHALEPYGEVHGPARGVNEHHRLANSLGADVLVDGGTYPICAPLICAP
jgi:hypothetical protein